MSHDDAHPAPDDAPEGPAERGAPAGSWGAWLLVLATAAPVVLWADTARRLLGSGVRTPLERFLGVPERTSFTARWESLLTTAPPSAALLCSAAGAAALAALALAGRPALLVPVGVVRRAAAAVAGLTAVVATAVVVAMLAYLAQPAEDGTPSRSGFPQGLLEVPAAAPVVGVAVFLAVLASLATVVLVRPAGPAAAGAPAAAPSEVDARATEDRPAGPGHPVADPRPLLAEAPREDPQADPRADGALPPAQLPRPDADELARYRRPR
ncbi:hypothetical protein GTR02_21820 [Kineococcus sp. R8]|uniref:hypothetical protein n=1 Tax=Kineococcus siccus TaxID=2696567 RepID=UPI001411DCD0|nr:hypothetical protein [Kineococcus siccus]NAZ84443.1 hypothetical protein [Kineococcus siccus]